MRNKLFIIIIALALAAACIIRRRKRGDVPEAENVMYATISFGGETMQLRDDAGSWLASNYEIDKLMVGNLDIIYDKGDDEISDEDWLAQMKEWHKDE